MANPWSVPKPLVPLQDNTATNPFAVLGQIGGAVPGKAPGTAWADATEATTTAISDKIKAERQKSIDAGLLDPETGWPTEKGWHEAAMAYAGGLGDGGMASSIRAYHASPHLFDAFDLSKLGTGQGNQVYGQGFSFAGNPEVAKWYQNNFAAKPGGSGHLYETNLNVDPTQLLNYDAPITQQPKPVQEIAAQLFGETDERLTGADVMDALSKVHPQGEAGAAQMLLDAGVPGAQYLNQQSAALRRKSGDSSSNYVIFDPALIEILSRDGGVSSGGTK